MKKFFNLLLIGTLTLYFFGSCKKSSDRPPINDNVDLDGKIIFDSSLITPANYLLSVAKPNPSESELNRPVIITAHGFSASNFEWFEFRNFIKTKPNVLISMVLLGGHGRDYDTFKGSTWEGWQQPIIDEYNKLRNLGYKKINIIGSSTGGTLALDLLSNNKINTDVLKKVFLIDAVIIPSNKTLPLIPIAGQAIGYSETTMEKGENGYWYKYRPYQAIQELDEIMKKKRSDLENGIVIPSGVKLKVYKSKQDDVADPVSAALIQKGAKHSDGSEVEVVMVESNLHVFTRLAGRNSFTQSDIDLQLKTFNEVYFAIQ